ncbi:MAG: nucleoside deaminase [Bacteroidales bacterium]|nr:nucleoside deaminase [Bacteroidales bacterium]
METSAGPGVSTGSGCAGSTQAKARRARARIIRAFFIGTNIINLSPTNKCNTGQNRYYLEAVRIFHYLCFVENQDERFMREALREAQAALAAGEIPIGAVIVSRGRVIGRGHNMTERLIDTTAHAEMVAITAATEAIGGKYLTDCTLYVTVEPCPMCAGALNWAQVGRIVYGAIDPRRGYTLFSPSLLHPRTQVTAGVLGDECTALMQDFFRSKR